MKITIEPILSYSSTLEEEFNQISNSRKNQLLKLSEYFSKQYQSGKTPKAIVICTHNSRRSHLGQLWLAVGADYFGLPKLETFSGGTEATAFNPRAVAALHRVGFTIDNDKSVNNPKYSIQWKNEMLPYIAFSKIYNETPNPSSDFVGIMVCTEADEACPVISGMDLRLALPFEDPKAFDDTELEAAKYDERCRQIAREMFFVLSNVQKS